MRIGILSAGGDCPGINATIRGVGKTAIVEYGMEVVGISNGFSGLLYKDTVELTEKQLSGILTLGGTILGTSREKPFKKMETDIVSDKPQVIKDNYNELGLDCLVCIGGNGTQKTASKLADIGLNVIGIPKTIDNDVFGTDITFGFDSAVNIATEAIDRLHTTANSHKRVMVIELMGHHAGWLTLHAGMASGADVILIPEIDFNIDIVCETLLERAHKGKPYSIVAVAEGIPMPEKHLGKKTASNYVARKIQKLTNLETRETILGYIQRGGSPSPFDRILSTQFGGYAAQLIHKEKFGQMVAMVDGKLVNVDLKTVAGKTRLIEQTNQLLIQGRRMGICFGDEPGEK